MLEEEDDGSGEEEEDGRMEWRVLTSLVVGVWEKSEFGGGSLPGQK
uniref:Uncharacterized protein n=1 Tax=Nelumbo nucifera TaxID=4432 RepID=A0A822YDF4_NELNU|nr:TPA_asm: hypothetical protein HUJ06_030473 [Nelumbo nucifera]